MSTTEDDLELNVIGPKSDKQRQFITSEAQVTVFGGAAGAGKSYLGVMDFLKYIHYPKFRGVITRRTTPQLKGPGGILDNALGLYQQLDPKVRWKDKDGYFQFSSGARIYLRHFETLSAKDNFQGSEVNLFLVDEGQQYEEAMVTYLMSRMRNPKCPEVMPHMKITCNPDYDSFLRKWLEWYLDPETGIPLPERDGAVRWFVVADGKMLWADSREEAIAKYGKADLPADHARQVKPLSFKFISANVYDNPVLMKHNPEYVAWLEGLGRVEKARLLHGSWLAREESSGYFKKEWVEEVALAPINAIQRVRAWDISGTLPSDTNPNPDWTAGVLMSKDKHSLYYVEDVVRDRRRHGGVEDLILETARRDGVETTILIPCDPGAAGKAYAAQLVRVLAEHGYVARIKQTNKSKVTRFAPFAAVAESGGVRLVRGPWNEDYIAELERFDGSRNVKDDQVDATGDAFTHLASNIHIPDFLPPDMTRENPFAIYR
jgi:predicted phage terminase large subunit-like protein